MVILGMTSVKRLNSHLNLLLVWKRLNFELPFRLIMIMLGMTFGYVKKLKP